MKGGLVVFRLGSEKYGIPLAYVRELGRVPKATPVPRLPAFVAGVANLRGNVVALVDLRTVVGAAASPGDDPAGRRMMVVSVDGVAAGLLVDGVEGVVEVDGELDPPVPTLPESVRAVLQGHFQHGRSLISVIDPAVIPALRERAEAEAG